MNPYQGFVPMVMPQHFMVAMPGMPLQGIQPPPHPVLPQMMPPSVAVAHAAGGMAPVSTAAAIAQGMPLAARPQAPPPGMTAIPGMSALADKGQYMATQGFPGMGSSNLSAEEAAQAELPEADAPTVLDDFNSDLNLIFDDDGYGAHTLNQPSGFCFTWAGARATHGICKGKAFYEVHITEHLPVDFGTDHQETNPHVVRVGWSIDSSTFQLGEEPWSYGYGGTGKFSTNNKFSNYGGKFEVGDVIGALLDLEDRPPSLSFMRNGTWLGVAVPLHSFPVGNKDMALFPHVLSKNCRFKVNFGQIDPWFPPPATYLYINQCPNRVEGMKAPEKISDCEMIMIVGLPGAGKTTWGLNMYKNHPDKRYNIIGTDTLIEKMRVMGLPRKNNYHGRWDVLITKASQCLNKLFTIAGRKKRNFILDQTNVYPSARRRKMKNFNGFIKIAAVIQPDDPELQRRSYKRTYEDGKVVPEQAVLEMKANFTLPEDRDNLFDRIEFHELPREHCTSLVEHYNKEGQEKRPPREAVFKHDQYQGGGNQNRAFGQESRDQSMRPGSRSRFQDDRDKGYDRRRGDRYQDQSSYGYDSSEPPNKKAKGDSGSALDILKQYGGTEDDHTGQAAASAGVWSDKPQVKEEARWEREQYGWSQPQFSSVPPPPPAPPNQQAYQAQDRTESQPTQNHPGSYNNKGWSQSWPPPPPSSGQQNWQNRDQTDQKPWQQNEPSRRDTYSVPENKSGFNSSSNATSYGDQQNASSFRGQQGYRGGNYNSYDDQQSSYGNQERQGSVGNQAENRMYGKPDSRQYEESVKDFGQKDSRNYGRDNVKGFGQDSRSYGHPDSQSYGRSDSRNFKQDYQSYDQQGSGSYGNEQESRNQDNSRRYSSQQEGYGRQANYQQKDTSEHFGNQQRSAGDYSRTSFGEQRRNDQYQNHQPRNSYNRGDHSAGYERDSSSQYSAPPPSQEREAADGRPPSYQGSAYNSEAVNVKHDNSINSGSQSGMKTERVRRRKSKWDTPSTDPATNPEIPSLLDAPQIPSVPIKEEPDTESFSQQQYSGTPEKLSNNNSANDSNSSFEQRNFDRPPPNNHSWKNSQSDQETFNNQSIGTEGGGSNKVRDSNQYGYDNQFDSEQQNRGPRFHHHGGPRPSFPGNRPPFEPRQPHGGPRGPPGGPRGPRPQFGPGGPRPFRPRNPQEFGGPRGGPGGHGGPPGGWNSNRPRFGPRGPGPRPPFNPRLGPDGGQRFPRPPGGGPRFNRA